MIEMQQEMIRQQQQQQQHDPKDAASSGGASAVDLGSSSQVVASAVAALDGGPRFGLVLPTVVSGENKSSPSSITFCPAYNEIGYNEHQAITRRFLCINIIDYTVKKFAYNEHPPITSRFFCIFLLVVSGTQSTQSDILFQMGSV